jgi:predicted  nucleic acid-binding Zn-ribbon protein
MSESSSNSRIKITAYIIALLLFVSLFIGAHYITLNKEAVANLNEEKLKSEALLSEKLQLQKEIDKYKKEIASLMGVNANLDQLLAAANNNLAQKEAQLSQIKRSNGSIAEMNRQIAELKAMKSGLDSQIVSLNGEISKLRDENGDLMKENANAKAAIAQLEKDNKALAENMSLLTALTEDNLVLVTKKNEKLTVNSKRAKKIYFVFDVPQSSLGGLEFKVVSPDSKTYSKTDGSVSYHMVPGDGNPVASISSTYPAQFELVQRVEMVFTPKDKLTKGIYKIEVYNNGTHLGRMQVKLK